MRRIGIAVIAGVVGLVASACEKDNPRYCASDTECRDPARAGYDPAKRECHFEGHFCYEGCATAADCTNTAKSWHVAGRAICDPVSKDCRSPRDGGGELVPDLPLVKKKKAETCGSPAECEAGLFCVDGLCCTGECSGVCEACDLSGSLGDCVKAAPGDDPRKKCTGDPGCAGACDGQGACSFSLVAGKACGALSCVSGELSSGSCSSDGKCTVGKQTCGGYACEAGGGGCKKTCSTTASDCIAPFKCVGQACVNDLPDGEPCGTNHDACKNKHCVDGVCCNSDCTGTCRSCALSGKLGTCTSVAAGLDPDTECKGDLACGNGSCNGSGGCSYPKAGTECSSSCQNSQPNSQQMIFLCSATHVCTAGAPTPCPFTLCDSVTKKCKTGCITHADCMTGSVCDRSAAHVTGLGVCVDPQKVEPVSSGTLAAAISAALAAGKTHLRVGAGTYAESVTVDGGKKITIIGDGVINIQPGTGDKPAVAVSGTGTSVVLQGLKLSNAGGADNADGVNCYGIPSGKASLFVIECEIADNKGQGIDATNCHVTLHRNMISVNSGGGVSVTSGNVEIVNNVIVGNGASGVIGGVKMDPGTGSTVKFVNNTVSKNPLAADGCGVICVGMSTKPIENSIVYGNLGGAQHQGCTFTYSDVEGATAPTGAGNLNVDPALNASYQPTAGVFNAGDSAAAAITKIDRANNPRVKGSAVDLGAFEIN